MRNREVVPANGLNLRDRQNGKPSMNEDRFGTPEAALAYMKDVAVKQSGFSNWLGVEPIKVWAGESEILLTVRPALTQHHGFAHGAIVGLMADNACAWAAASIGGDVVTGNYTINFLAPAVGTRLRAKASVVRAGKRQIIATAKVWAESDDGTDKLVAVAQATIIPV
jgi:uncharacterized protein (TIGR00369 family)